MFIWRHSTLTYESTDKQTLLVIKQLKWIRINGARMITESPQLPKHSQRQTQCPWPVGSIKTPCRLCQTNKRGVLARACRYTVHTHLWVGGFTIYLYLIHLKATRDTVHKCPFCRARPSQLCYNVYLLKTFVLWIFVHFFTGTLNGTVLSLKSKCLLSNQSV